MCRDRLVPFSFFLQKKINDIYDDLCAPPSPRSRSRSRLTARDTERFTVIFLFSLSPSALFSPVTLNLDASSCFLSFLSCSYSTAFIVTVYREPFVRSTASGPTRSRALLSRKSEFATQPRGHSNGRQLVNPQYPNLRSCTAALFSYQIIRGLSYKYSGTRDKAISPSLLSSIPSPEKFLKSPSTMY